MAKKVIQVPIDESLLETLDAAARKRGRSRAELIRVACQRYLGQEEQRELDEVYQAGYRRLPEEPAEGEVQATLAGQVVSEEAW